MLYVGIDISKSKFDVCLKNDSFDTSTFLAFPNDFKGFNSLLVFLSSSYDLNKLYLGFESTSTYMIPLQKFLEKKQITYMLVNTISLNHFIKYNNFQNKTDQRDSFYIALYLETFATSQNSSSISQFRNFYKMYNTSINLLMKMEVQFKGINDSLKYSDERSDLHLTMLSMQKYIKSIRVQITDDLIKEIMINIPYYDNIKSDLVGVGDKTLLSVLPLIFDISDKYTIKQLQSFIGLNPVYTQSGSSVNKRQFISKRGDVQVRKMLYMSALSSIRYNDFLREKYQRLLANGKPKKVALVAISAHIFRAIVSKLNYYKLNYEVKN
ncbi:MAG: transposase [Thiovulaceae bacterium]|nr:transposase [Sulfurimonadaceae bacterium]